MKLALIPLYATILPFVIWPIEVYLLPYPFFVEEIAKGILIFFIASKKIKVSKKAYLVLAVGILFTLSESILYLFNIYYARDLSIFSERLLTTGFLHILTSFVIFFFARKNKYLGILGLIFAIIVHYLYNMYIPDIL